MPISNEGSSTNLTLFFKYANLTVLLYAEPTTPMSDLKIDLLEILTERYPKGLPLTSPELPEESVIPHPSKSTDIILGKLVDNSDENAGWEEIQGGGIKGTPEGIGLKDGASVAFAYKDTYEEEGFTVKRSTYYDEQSRADEEEPEDHEMDGGETNA